ncbi:MAG: DnaB-like helicase C-terminal domain-containing protein [Nitrosopumilaceae archaeon]
MDEFSEKKQKLLIEYLISSIDIFVTCIPIVEASYFDPRLRNAVAFIKRYYDNYNAVPNIEQIEGETALVFQIREVEEDQQKYCSEEIERFCRYKAVEKVVLDSPDLMAKGDYGLMVKKFEDAVSISLNEDLGLRYFENPRARLEAAANSGNVEPTGWKDLDKELGGGIARKEMLLFAGGRGGGKSLTLANLGFNFLERKLNVLYISLELSRDVVSQRFDSMLTGKGQRGVFKYHIPEIAQKIEAAAGTRGILDVIDMPSGTKPIQIRAYLKKYQLKYKFVPDMLILDYLDKMSPNEHVSADNVFEKDKRCSEQLRDIGVDYNMFIATASQLNRSSVGVTTHDHSHIAGGISKINETDIYISISLIKHAGQMFFHLEKTRNSSGQEERFVKNWDSTYLRITDVGGTEENQPINIPVQKKTGLRDLRATL